MSTYHNFCINLSVHLNLNTKATSMGYKMIVSFNELRNLQCLAIIRQLDINLERATLPKCFPFYFSFPAFSWLSTEFARIKHRIIFKVNFDYFNFWGDSWSCCLQRPSILFPQFRILIFMLLFYSFKVLYCLKPLTCIE